MGRSWYLHGPFERDAGTQKDARVPEMPTALSLCPLERRHGAQTGSHQSHDPLLTHPRFSWFL